MKFLFENWRRYVLSEGISLTDKEKAEAENLLKMRGFQLQNHVQMYVQMGAQSVYEKILGAFLAGVYDSKGEEKAAEIMEIAPQLTPVEGDFEQDSSESVVFEEGPYITRREWTDIQRYVDIFREEKNKLDVAKAIQSDADRHRDYTGWVLSLSKLFRRLRDYGSYLDESRGALLARGGWKRAVDAGYITRPEDGEKIAVGKNDWDSIAGTRVPGYDLVEAIADYVDKRPPWER